MSWLPTETWVDKFPSRERAAAATTEPRVSAVVVVHAVGAKPSSRSPLELCLRSVLAEPMVDELIVVDHANDAAISSALRSLRADRRDVELIAAPAGMSRVAAANLGASHAHGRWLLFLDSSVVLQRGSVARLATLNNNARGLWVAGGRITDLEGRERTAVRAGSLNTFSAIAVALSMPGAKRGLRRRPAANAARVAAVSGAFMLIPHGDFDQLNGFDEGYATDGADLDLCRRMAEAGGSVLFHPLAAGVQFERAARDRRLAQGLARFASRSAKTPLDRAFAAIALPALLVLVALKDLVMGRPPLRR